MFSQLSHLLGDVLDLGDFRLGSQQRLLNNLNASLRLAKEETAQKCEQIAILEAEVSYVSIMGYTYVRTSLVYYSSAKQGQYFAIYVSRLKYRSRSCATFVRNTTNSTTTPPNSGVC